LKMPAFEWVHVQLHQQKGMISLSPPTICNSARTKHMPSGFQGAWFLLNTSSVPLLKGSSQKTESMVTPVFATPILTTSWLA
ncbi:hypothetical protein, partial [Klebsiella aerogenes]|uniref:hypothetical protein n=1 Tax=Klebsiella aerogenes TaxID=548 RepID=UPI001967B1B8